MLTLRKMVAGRGHCGTIIRGGPIVILVISGLLVAWEGGGVEILSYLTSCGAKVHFKELYLY